MVNSETRKTMKLLVHVISVLNKVETKLKELENSDLRAVIIKIE